MKPDSRTRHFRIGVVHASLTTSLHRLLDEYTSLYREFQTDRPGEGEIRITVGRTPLSVRHRRRYQVSADGFVHFEPTRFQEVLPYVEWSLNLQIPRVMPQSLQLHSSALEVDGQGVIFPGLSGVGKSTLTAGLLARGWRYLCDEFALIHTGTLQLQPYPRAICIKRASHPIIESLGLAVHGNRHYVKAAKGLVGFIRPKSVRSDVVGRACPVRYIIFPKYTQGAGPALVPISRAEAAFELHRFCFNLLRCRGVGLDVLAGVVRGASCYRLTAGEITETCDVVQGLVERAEQHHARSA